MSPLQGKECKMGRAETKLQPTKQPRTVIIVSSIITCKSYIDDLLKKLELTYLHVSFMNTTSRNTLEAIPFLLQSLK